MFDYIVLGLSQPTSNFIRKMYEIGEENTKNEIDAIR